jgi:hypothetical protein
LVLGVLAVQGHIQQVLVEVKVATQALALTLWQSAAAGVAHTTRKTLAALEVPVVVVHFPILLVVWGRLRRVLLAAGVLLLQVLAAVAQVLSVLTIQAAA